MIITVAFGKGGTGKTSTALAMAHYKAAQGAKVLCIDLDHQGNFTYALGGDMGRPGMFDVLTGAREARDVMQSLDGVDLLPAGVSLDTAELAIASKPGRDFLLKAALEPVAGDYDLTVIDTHPDRDTLLVNALSASDSVILPMKADPFAVMGLYQIAQTIADVQRLCNPALKVAGIVLTQYKPKQVLARDMREAIEQQAEAMGTKLFHTTIREGVAVQQAQALRQPLFDYAGKSNPARDYKELFEEMEL